MVCQARFFLCVHGAHAVAAERPITHKPSTRWLRAAVGLMVSPDCTPPIVIQGAAPRAASRSITCAAAARTSGGAAAVEITCAIWWWAAFSAHAGVLAAV